MPYNDYVGNIFMINSILMKATNLAAAGLAIFSKSFRLLLNNMPCFVLYKVHQKVISIGTSLQFMSCIYDIHKNKE